MLPHFPLLKWKHLPQIYFSPCLFLWNGSQNIHPCLSVSLVRLLCFKWGQARILSSDHLHPRCSKLMFCVYPCWMFKVPLTSPCYPGALAYACDLHIEGCSCRLVLYETMKPGVFMHMSVLATAASACVFTSYHTPLLLAPASLHCALIPPRLSGLPLFFFFYPQFPLGMWLMLHCLFVHTAQVTPRTEGSVCLGSSGSGERQRGTLELSHRYKNQQRKR